MTKLSKSLVPQSVNLAEFGVVWFGEFGSRHGILFSEWMSMQFCFYPNHEHACPDVGHCPHLGGAALGALVLRANQSGSTIDGLHRTIDAERKHAADCGNAFKTAE